MSVHEELFAEWKRVNLASLSAFITKGTTPTTYGFKWEPSGVLFLRSECVSDHGLDLAQSMFISAAAHNAMHRSQVLPNDLLITITGNVGRVVMFAGAEAANLNQHIARVRITDPQAHPRFIYHWLSQESVRRHFTSITTGQAYPQISLSQVRNTEVPLPPLEQQAAIAAALSDMDALLAGLDRLIAKKRDLKQAAMQQLLTGRTRLPNFQGGWEVKRLGDIAPLQRGFDLPNPALRPGPYPVVYSNGVLTHHDEYQARGPGVVTGRSGTIGRVTYIESGPYWPHNTALWVTTFRQNDPKFVFYLYTSIGFQRFSSGSGVPTLNRNDAHAFEIAVPPDRDEQSAIAAVLTDMDAELAALEARRDKTRALKQGMMQELLTGRTRLV